MRKHLANVITRINTATVCKLVKMQGMTIPALAKQLLAPANHIGLRFQAIKAND